MPILNKILEPTTFKAISLIMDNAPTPPVLFPFIFNVKTDNNGVSANNQFKVPTESAGTYAATVDWGDGNIESGFNTFNDPRWTHTYSLNGTYTIKITGVLTGWRFDFGGDRSKLTNISAWGVLKILNTGSSFYGCQNLTITATDVFDISANTSLFRTFQSCQSITTIPSINSWDFSNIINLEQTFRSCTQFNQDMNSIDTSSVENMRFTFSSCPNFNGDVTSWDVSRVETFESCFVSTNFNRDIGGWEMESAIIIASMLSNCPFDQNIGGWNVSQLSGPVAASNFLFFSTLSVANYDALLIGWNARFLNPNIPFHGGNSQYSAGAAAAARANMISSDNWSITDGGQAA